MDENKKQKICIVTVITSVLAFVALVLTTLAIIIVTNDRFLAVQNSLREMNNALSEMSDKLDSMSQVPEEPQPAESNSPAEEVPSYTQEELIAMAVSDDFSNMMEVALYPEATESQLLFIATACAYSNSVGDETSAVRLATALLDHPSATKAVASTLANAKSKLVWLIVAQSELSSEQTLAVLTANCITNSYSIPNNDPLIAVVGAICENNAVTEDVLNMFEHCTNSKIRFIVDTKLGKFPNP